MNEFDKYNAERKARAVALAAGLRSGEVKITHSEVGIIRLYLPDGTYYHGRAAFEKLRGAGVKLQLTPSLSFDNGKTWEPAAFQEPPETLTPREAEAIDLIDVGGLTFLQAGLHMRRPDKDKILAERLARTYWTNARIKLGTLPYVEPNLEFESLPAHYREVLELREVDKWTFSRIAEHFKVSVTGANARYTKAVSARRRLNRLRVEHKLQPFPDPTEDNLVAEGLPVRRDEILTLIELANSIAEDQ